MLSNKRKCVIHEIIAYKHLKIQEPTCSSYARGFTVLVLVGFREFSKVMQTVSNSPNLRRVYLRLCEHGRCTLSLKSNMIISQSDVITIRASRLRPS